MKNIKNVFLFEVRTKLKEKTVIISTLIMVIIFFGITFIPAFLKDDPKTTENQIEELGKIGLVIENKTIDENKLKEFMPFKIATIYDSSEQIKKAINDDKIKNGIIIKSMTHYELIKSGDMISFVDITDVLGIDEGLLAYNRVEFFKENNIDLDVIKESEKIVISKDIIDIGKSAENNYWIAYVGTFIVYFLIIIYGVSVATSVAREKNDRTMEILITNTSAKSLIIGKVLASLLVSIVQVILVLGSAIIGFLINKNSFPKVLVDMINNNISIELIIVFLAFTFVGCLMYYFVYAALGSLVSRVEEVSNAISPIQIIFVGAFMVAMMGMYDPNSSLMVITSYLPFTSPMSMFIRYSMVNIPIGELLMSFALLVIMTIILVYISIKIYRQATLNYGNRLTLKKVFRDIKKNN